VNRIWWSLATDGAYSQFLTLKAEFLVVNSGNNQILQIKFVVEGYDRQKLELQKQQARIQSAGNCRIAADSMRECTVNWRVNSSQEKKRLITHWVSKLGVILDNFDTPQSV
jgi:hypothetical protein